MHFLLVFLTLACQAAIKAPQNSNTQATSFKESLVFQNGQDGFQCYRIPAIVKAPNGDLLAFAEARKHTCSDHGDVRIVMKRSTDQGNSWGQLIEVANNGLFQAGNPAPVFDLTDSKYPKGRLFLFYNTGTVSEQEVRQGKAIREVWYKTSTDGGKTWDAPRNITLDVNRPKNTATNAAYNFVEDWRSYANTPGHGVQVQNGRFRGRIFIAANHSAGPPQANFKDYRAHGFYTDDHGATFKLSPDIDYAGSNEAIAAETSTGSILMNCRNQSGDARFRILGFSDQAGAHWSDIRVMNELPDPVCQGSMISYQTPQGKWALLFTNPNSQTKREKLTIRLSTDDGKTWPISREIYAGPAAYSDLVIQQNRNIGVLYEQDGYTRIVYAQFDYDWLVGK